MPPGRSAARAAGYGSQPEAGTVCAVVAAIALLAPEDASRSLGGDLGPIVVGLAFGAAPQAGSQRATPWRLGIALSLFLFAALPRDWMGAHRFATPFVTLGTPWIVVSIGQAIATTRGCGRRLAATLAAVAALCLIVTRNVRTSAAFYDASTLSMQRVSARVACFERWAAEIGRTSASILIPDVGGALWANSFVVHDLGGLCSRDIAPLLGSSPERTTELVLSTLRPTFIEFHNRWTVDAGLYDDARFARDYAPIAVAMDAFASEHAGRIMQSGANVRRDVAPPPATLLRRRSDYR